MRSTNSAPDFLSNSYFTGSPPTGTSMMTLRLSGGLSPIGTMSIRIGLPLSNTREPARPARDERSEEHTSELQSLMRISYAVFCLKKKKNNTRQHNTDVTEY